MCGVVSGRRRGCVGVCEGGKWAECLPFLVETVNLVEYVAKATTLCRLLRSKQTFCDDLCMNIAYNYT